MERKTPVGHRPTRGVVYDRMLVVPHRQVAETRQHVVKSSVPVKSTVRPVTASVDHVYFDMKPAHKRPKHTEHNAEQKPILHQEPDFDIDIVADVPKQIYSPMHPTPHMLGYGKRSVWPWHRSFLYGTAVLLFVIGAGVLAQGILVNKQPAAVQASVLSEQTTTPSSSDPSEALPMNTDSYRVASELPRLITIPSLGVSARILHLGTDEKNELKAPRNIFDVGWYEKSALTGDSQGAMLIDGHVSGPTKKGVFYSLKTLQIGDEIDIERGDGQTTTFVVANTKITKANEIDMNEMLQPVDKTKLGLNLMTCAGKFDPKTNTFESRVQVFAVKK